MVQRFERFDRVQETVLAYFVSIFPSRNELESCVTTKRQVLSTARVKTDPKCHYVEKYQILRRVRPLFCIPIGELSRLTVRRYRPSQNRALFNPSSKNKRQV